MIVLRLISMLPLRVLYMMSSLIAYILFHIIGYRKGVVMQNLRQSFPEKTDAELRPIAMGFYKNFADVLVETLKAYTITEKEMKERVEFIGFEQVEQAYTHGHHMIMLASHQCNWEWLLLGFSAYYNKRVVGVYKPLASDFADNLMQYIRSRFGAHPVRMHQLAKRMIKMRHTPEIYGMVADQSPGGRSDIHHWQMFLNQETMFYKGISILAPKLQAVVMYVSMERTKRGHYKVIMEELRKPPYDTKEDLSLLREYAQKLEVSIRANPSDWLWSHKRWKRERPDDVVLH